MKNRLAETGSLFSDCLASNRLELIDGCGTSEPLWLVSTQIDTAAPALNELPAV